MSKQIRQDVVAADVERLLDEMDRQSTLFEEGAVKELVRKVRSEWKSSFLSDRAVDHLSKWCWPNRNSARERMFKPLARQLSMALFGEIVERRPGV